MKAIKYNITEVYYCFPRPSMGIPERIGLSFCRIDEPSNLDYPAVIELTQKKAQSHGIKWDGTEMGVKKIKKTLEGKTFTLDLRIKS